MYSGANFLWALRPGLRRQRPDEGGVGAVAGIRPRDRGRVEGQLAADRVTDVCNLRTASILREYRGDGLAERLCRGHFGRGFLELRPRAKDDCGLDLVVLQELGGDLLMKLFVLHAGGLAEYDARCGMRQRSRCR